VIARRRSGQLVLAIAALGFPGLGAAQALGPNPALCAGGREPTILVRVAGLKNREGTVRVRTFTGSPDTYFNKKFADKRFEYDVPAFGPIEICVPVGAPGTYAVDIRHDVNKNGDTDRSDGIGASGNPKFSLMSILFGRKPPASQVQVSVANGTTIVPITVRYL